MNTLHTKVETIPTVTENRTRILKRNGVILNLTFFSLPSKIVQHSPYEIINNRLLRKDLVVSQVLALKGCIESNTYFRKFKVIDNHFF
jgi:hypothetical protein